MLIICFLALTAVWFGLLLAVWRESRKSRLVKITTEATPVKPFPWDFN